MNQDRDNVINYPGAGRTADQADRQASSETEGAKSATTATHFNLFSLTKFTLIQAPDHPDLFAYLTDAVGPALVPITSRRFQNFLNQLMDTYTGGDPEAYLGKAEFQDYLDFLRAKAQRIAEIRPVFKRTAWLSDEQAIWIDLSRNDGQCIRITASCWSVEERLHPLFVRLPTQLPLPMPEHNEDGEAAYQRILPPGMTPEHSKLLLGAMLGMLLPSNFVASFAYPVTVLTGDAGSGKSTLAKAIKRLVDNEVTTVATKPRSVDDLYVDAQGSHLLNYDNLDYVKHSLSDGLCQLATGGAVTKRKLYTDSDRTILRGHNPLLLNGISVDIPKSDLLDRSVNIHLSRITAYDADAANHTEADLSLVMGYLCDLLTRALTNYATTTVTDAPRLSLLAKICAAAEPFVCPTPYADLLRANQHEALLASRDNDLVVSALFDLLRKQSTWTGTFKQLLGTLTSTADDTTIRSQEWPSTPHKLARHMREHARLLRAQGLAIEAGRKTENGRLVTVSRIVTDTTDTEEIPF